MSISLSGIVWFSQDKQLGFKAEPEHFLQYLMGHSRHFKFGDRSSGRKNPGLQLKQSSCSSLHLRQFSFSPSIHLFDVGDTGDAVGDIGDDVGDIGDDVGDDLGSHL